MDNKVYVARCTRYQDAEKKLSELFHMMGGMKRFTAPGERIALKINLLRPATPEDAVSTHPAVAAAVARLTTKEGALPFIIDSPGAGYRHNRKTLERVYRVSGITAVSETDGLEVNLDTTYEGVSYPEGRLVKHFEVLTPILRADGVFNLCKMKTHSFMYMTGAVKNSFGIIPGLTKPGYHANLQDPGRFANMLLDLTEYLSPRVSIMDAVVAMEGEGPSEGAPRELGYLLAATSPLALDVVAGEMMGLSPQKNPVLVEAEKRGLGPTNLDEVELIGVNPQDLRIPDFKLPATVFGGGAPGGTSVWQKLLLQLFKGGMSVKPRIIRERCIACGACREACPMQVITIVEGDHARIDHRGCIRCYCCHEMCPEKAVELHRSLLYLMINR